MNILIYTVSSHIYTHWKDIVHLNSLTPCAWAILRPKIRPLYTNTYTYFTRFLVYSSTCWILSLLSGMKIAASPENRSVPHYNVTHTHTDGGCPEALETWTGRPQVSLPLVAPLFVYVVFSVHQGGTGECFPQLLLRCMFMSAGVFDVRCWAGSCFLTLIFFFKSLHMAVYIHPVYTFL